MVDNTDANYSCSAVLGIYSSKPTQVRGLGADQVWSVGMANENSELVAFMASVKRLEKIGFHCLGLINAPITLRPEWTEPIALPLVHMLGLITTVAVYKPLICYCPCFIFRFALKDGQLWLGHQQALMVRFHIMLVLDAYLLPVTSRCGKV